MKAGGKGAGGMHPAPLRDDLRLLNMTDILQKNYVVCWCWSKTRDNVEEFILTL